jgi:hypothetical protein
MNNLVTTLASQGRLQEAALMLGIARRYDPDNDESQITSLFRALLELSSGKLDLQQRQFAPEYTASLNSDLYASIFGITRTRDFDVEEMRGTIEKSPVFSGEELSVQNLEDWSKKMNHFLPVGFCDGHLVGYPNDWAMPC